MKIDGLNVLVGKTQTLSLFPDLLLEEGRQIVAKVIDRSAGEALLEIAGRPLTAKIEGNLPDLNPGAVVSLRVGSDNQGRILLKVVTPPAEQAPVDPNQTVGNQTGLMPSNPDPFLNPVDKTTTTPETVTSQSNLSPSNPSGNSAAAFTRQIVAALVDNGLPPQPENIAKIASLVRIFVSKYQLPLDPKAVAYAMAQKWPVNTGSLLTTWLLQDRHLRDILWNNLQELGEGEPATARFLASLTVGTDLEADTLMARLKSVLSQQTEQGAAQAEESAHGRNAETLTTAPRELDIPSLGDHRPPRGLAMPEPKNGASRPQTSVPEETQSHARENFETQTPQSRVDLVAHTNNELFPELMPGNDGQLREAPPKGPALKEAGQETTVQNSDNAKETRHNLPVSIPEQNSNLPDQPVEKGIRASALPKDGSVIAPATEIPTALNPDGDIPRDRETILLRFNGTLAEENQETVLNTLPQASSSQHEPGGTVPPRFTEPSQTQNQAEAVETPPKNASPGFDKSGGVAKAETEKTSNPTPQGAAILSRGPDTPDKPVQPALAPPNGKTRASASGENDLISEQGPKQQAISGDQSESLRGDKAGPNKETPAFKVMSLLEQNIALQKATQPHTNGELYNMTPLIVRDSGNQLHETLLEWRSQPGKETQTEPTQYVSLAIPTQNMGEIHLSLTLDRSTRIHFRVSSEEVRQFLAQHAALLQERIGRNAAVTVGMDPASSIEPQANGVDIRI